MDPSEVKYKEVRESERSESNNVISGKERLFKGEVGILAALVRR